MKKLFTLIALVAALLIVNRTQAQTTDSTKFEDLDLRLDNFSKQHSTGNALVTSGVIVSSIGSTVLVTETKNAYKSYHKEPIRIGLPLTIAGGVLSTIGGIINMTAHRKVRSKKYNTRYPKNPNYKFSLE